MLTTPTTRVVPSSYTHSECHRYAKPPAVDEEMMMALRTLLGMTVMGQICMSAFAAQSLGIYPGTPLPTYGANVAVYVLSPALLVLYAVVPLGKLHESFRFSGDSDEALTGDTDGVHFDDVPRLKGYEMEPYICPRYVYLRGPHGEPARSPCTQPPRPFSRAS